MAAKRKTIIEEFQPMLKKKPRSIRETIYQVRQILKDRKRWCKNENFKDGRGVYTVCDEAMSCCLAGALEIVGGLFESKAKERIVKIIARDFPRRHSELEAFNDHASHKEIVALLNNAFEVR